MQGPIRDDNIGEPALDFRAFVNNALGAISSWQLGSVAPTQPQAGMMWIDTSTSPATIRHRNLENTAWLQIGTLSANWGLNNAGTLSNTLNQLIATGTTPAVEDKFSVNGWCNVKSYGAKGDGVFLYDSVVSGTGIVCATTAPFTGRAGQTILIPGAKSANLTNSIATGGTTTLFQARATVKLSVASRISFSGGNTINDSSNGLTSFSAGELLFLTDGNGSGNTGIYTILSVAGGGGSMTVGRLLSTTIASVTNSSHAVLTDAADNAVTVGSTWSAATPFVSTDDTAAVQAAIDAATAGIASSVYAPPAFYLVTGLTIENSAIRFVGAGGIGQHGGAGATNPRMMIQAATVFVSATDAPIFNVTAVDKTIDRPAMWSSLEDFAVLGFSMQGSSFPSIQDGILLDSRGAFLKNVSAFRCGSNGFNLTDVIDGHLQLCAANFNRGDGFRLDGQAAIATGGGVTSTTFIACTALGNFSNGCRIDGGTVNCRWLGGSVERNAEYGFLFDQSHGGVNITADNSVWGVHEESNVLGSVNFRNATALVKKNEVHGRWSSAPIFGLAYVGNTVSGIISTDAVPYTRTQIRKLLTAGAKDSGDTDHLSLRNQADNGDGTLQCLRVVITRAVTDSPDAFNASAPQLLSGNGSPEGVIAAVVGSLYMRLNGGASTSFYVKESGTGNTGWVAK